MANEISVETRFLKWLFDSFSKKEVDYMVLRNYESLPKTVEGSDIDILVKKKGFSSLTKFISSEIHTIGYRSWKTYRKNYGMVQFSFVPVNVTDPQEIIRVDFIFDRVQWLGKDILPAKELWENVTYHNKLKVLEHNTAVLLTAINSLVYSGTIKEKYNEQFEALNSDEQQRLFNLFSVTPNPDLKELGAESLASIRKSFLFKDGVPLAGILYAVASWLKTFVSRVIHPPGQFIAMLGPDGAGKSTLAELLRKDCRRLFPGISYFHLFPKLKIFRFLDKKSHKRWESRQQSGQSESEMRNKNFGLISSLLRLEYLWLRFTLGYFLNVFPKKMAGQLIISDRWCYDILFDPGSKGIQLPYWIRKFVYFFIPKPADIFVLTGQAEVFAARKKDLTEEAIQKQITDMQDFFSGLQKSKFIRTDQKPEDSFKELLGFLINQS